MSKLIIAIAVVNGLAVVALGVSRIPWPDAAFWQNNAGLVIFALGVTGASPILQALLAEYGERSRRKSLEREEDVRTCLVASLVYMVKHAGADWEHTGLQTFRVRRRRLFWKEQVRIAKIRLAAIPASGIVWTEGKGAIGRCWATRTRQYVDVERHFKRYERLTEPEWNLLPADDRYGLTYADFQSVRGKYGIVAAVPIIGPRDKYIGCVTLDVPPKFSQDLDRDEALESLATAAALVQKALAR